MPAWKCGEGYGWLGIMANSLYKACAQSNPYNLHKALKTGLMHSIIHRQSPFHCAHFRFVLSKRSSASLGLSSQIFSRASTNAPMHQPSQCSPPQAAPGRWSYWLHYLQLCNALIPSGFADRSLRIDLKPDVHEQRSQAKSYRGPSFAFGTQRIKPRRLTFRWRPRVLICRPASPCRLLQ